MKRTHSMGDAFLAAYGNGGLTPRVMAQVRICAKNSEHKTLRNGMARDLMVEKGLSRREALNQAQRALETVL